MDCQGGHWAHKPDGGYTVTLAGVASVQCSKDGDIEAMAPVIRAVTIADLSQVVEHSITRLYDTVCLFDICGCSRSALSHVPAEALLCRTAEC